MKLIHTADWHLGNTFHGHDRADEHAHFLSWLLEVVRQQRPDALIISGDIFDTANPPARAEKQFFDFLIQATSAVEGLQVVATAGNHDSAGRLEAPAELLKVHNVYVRGMVRRLEDSGEVDFDHYLLPLSPLGQQEAVVTCFAVPYLRTSDYPSGLSTTEGLAWFLDNLCKRYRKTPFKSLPAVVAAHFYAAGAEICQDEHSERLVVGGQDCVEAGRVDCGALYTALGHIHKAQRVGCVKSDMYYAGSALPMSFSEKGYRHGVNLVTISETGETEVSRLEYTPLRALLSIPNRGAVSTDALFDAIAALPQREKNDDGATWPYLEMRVLENQPNPSLLHEATEALADKAVHFCRMVRELPPAASEPGKIGSVETLRSIQPIDMAKRVFESRYNTDMPEALQQRFNTAYEKAVSEIKEGEQ